MKNKVLIFGITGQDGFYLSEMLLNLGFYITGVSRKSKKFKNQSQKINSKKINTLKGNIANFDEVYKLILKIKPNYIFNLTNIESIKYSFEYPINTYQSIFNGNLNILESIMLIDKSIKYFSSSSCEIFGDNLKGTVNENTNFKPNNNYGIAKKYAFDLVKYYREKNNIFCCSGILFNHESPIREERYLPINLINNCISIKKDKKKKIKINNLLSKCDWGWAPDYVEAFYKILMHNMPDDYIIASGNTYSVLDLVKTIFNYFDYDYKKYIIVENKNKSSIRNINNFEADTSKIRKKLQWFSDKDLNFIVNNIIKSKLDV